MYTVEIPVVEPSCDGRRILERAVAALEVVALEALRRFLSS